MKHSELTSILRHCMKGNKARLACLVHFILAFLVTRTVNLTDLATAVSSSAKQASRHMRLRRFLKSGFLSQESVAVLLWDLFHFERSPVLLTLDRTNWQWGKANINILMLAVVCQGIAIPLFWSFLPKKGNSNSQERIQLMERFLALFGKKRLKGVVADREFVGQKWIGYLIDHEIPFHIRVKNNPLSTTKSGKETTLKSLFYGTKPGEMRVLDGKRHLSGHALFLSGTMTQAGEWLIIASGKDNEQALKRYAQRWEIETLFQSLKSRGFHFENTHITQADRLDALTCLLALSFSLAYRVGEWRSEQKPIEILKHGRPQHSCFRYGLDWIREAFLNEYVSAQEFAHGFIKSLNLSRFKNGNLLGVT